jgi:hypothetical protein
MRKHVTLPTVLSVLALFIAMSGTAVAANAVLIKKNSQVAPHTISGASGPKAAKKNIIAGSIGSSDLHAGSVTGAQIASSSVGTAQLQSGAVGAGQLADGSVLSGKLADGTVTTAKVADGAITATKVADGSLTGAKFADGSIDVSKLKVLSYSITNVLPANTNDFQYVLESPTVDLLLPFSCYTNGTSTQLTVAASSDKAGAQLGGLLAVGATGASAQLVTWPLSSAYTTIVQISATSVPAYAEGSLTFGVDQKAHSFTFNFKVDPVTGCSFNEAGF